MTEPSGNRFLDALEPDEAARLRPLLKPSTVAAGQTVSRQEEPIREVYFPLSCQFANIVRMRDGASIETAVVGAEGVTGLAPFMAERPCAWDIVCRASGDALAAPASALLVLAMERPALMRRLLALTDLYQAQAAQSAACNALHDVPSRIARWILTAHDLSPGRDLEFRQEELAQLIGARRTTVSEAASQLKARKLIAYGRGVIRVADADGLSAAACDCYRMLKPRLDRVHD